MSSVRLTGDWEKLAGTLRIANNLAVLAMDRAVRQEALLFERRLVKRFTSGDFKPNPPLSAATLAIRARKGFAGTKALIETGTLRNSITSTKPRRSAGSRSIIFVGVLRTAHPSGGDVANIGAIHEQPDGKPVFAGRNKNVLIPKRAFIKPTIDELRPGTDSRMAKVFKKAMKDSLGG